MTYHLKPSTLGNVLVLDLHGVIERSTTVADLPLELFSTSLAVAGLGLPSSHQIRSVAIEIEADLARTVQQRKPFHLHPILWIELLQRLGKEQESVVEVERLVYETFCRQYAELTSVIYDDARALLRRAAEANVKVGILSNGNWYRIRLLLEASGIYEFCDGLVVSGDSMYRKPDREIFKLLSGKLNLTSLQGATMIGDRYDTDGVGAEQSGMTFVHLRRAIHTPESPHLVPTISDLDEVTFGSTI